MTNRLSRKRVGVPGVEMLKNNETFHQILELDFKDMIPFVLANIRKPGLIPILYVAINAIALLFILLYLFLGLSGEWLTLSDFLKQFFIGIFLGSFLIMPVHELLHGFAYKVLGARKIHFGALLKHFIFYVTADRFPVTGQELCFLAMLPFLVINIVILLLTILWIPHLALLSAFLLLSHNMMCIGDFAMVNYALKEKGKLYTFDEPDQMKSYFYKGNDKAFS